MDVIGDIYYASGNESTSDGVSGGLHSKKANKNKKMEVMS